MKTSRKTIFLILIIFTIVIIPISASEGSFSIERKQLEIEQKIKEAYFNYTRGSLLEAELIYAEILRDDPDNFRALYSLGIIYQQQGIKDKAIEKFQRCIEINPDFAPSYNNLGWVYFTLGKYDKAQVLYMMAIKKDPGYLLAYSNLGTIYMIRNELNMAENIFRKILEFQHDNTIALNNLGLTYLRRGELYPAKEIFETVLKYDPYSAAAFINLSQVYQNLGLWGKALQSLENAQEFSPRSMAVNFAFGSLYFDMGNSQKARGYLKKVLKANPYHYGATRLLADILIEEKDGSAAEKKLNILASIAPNDHWAYTELGKLYLADNSYDKAIEYFKKSLDKKPDQYETWNLLGVSFEQAGDNEQAYNSYYQSAFLKTDYVPALLNLSRLLILSNKNLEANNYVTQVLSVDPKNSSALKLKKFLKKNI
ncbi:MAG: tetratricopeptide repeat protein [Vulcanimicrobiota bacterium]